MQESYNPKDLEKEYKKNGIHKDLAKQTKIKKFYCLSMFPYPRNLHIGMSETIQ